MNVRQFGQLALLGAIWGASFLFMRIAAPVLGPLYLIEFRVLLAGLALLPIVWLRGQQRHLLAHRRHLLITGLLGAALPFSLLAFATLELTAGLTSVLNATVPIFAALFGAVWLGDALSRLGLVGLVLGLFGVIVLVGVPGLGADGPSWASVAAGLCAAISYVLAAYYAKQYLPCIPPLTITTGSQLCAALGLLPLLPVGPVMAEPDAVVIMCVIALALLSTSTAFVVYFGLLQEVGPTKTLTVTYLIPLFAMFFGAIFVGEPITLTMLLGCGLIFCGTALANGLRLSRAPDSG